MMGDTGGLQDIFGSQDFKGAAQETEPLTSDAHDGAAQPALSQEV